MSASNRLSQNQQPHIPKTTQPAYDIHIRYWSSIATFWNHAHKKTLQRSAKMPQPRKARRMPLSRIMY
jgi:hypothetical protein